MTQSIKNERLKTKGIAVDVLRLDLLHPQVSGNKWFKLKYYLREAIANRKSGMISFGGAYSNHLVAMAYLCKSNGIHSTGIIRGEEQVSNHSLEEMKKYGMDLLFISRGEYRDKQEFISNYLIEHPERYYVPEGGTGAKGIEGAADIMNLVSRGYTHIAVAIGTGTTVAGLINGAGAAQKIIGVYCVKLPAHENPVLAYVHEYAKNKNYDLISGYEFGGFGRRTDLLTDFMNSLYQEEKIPTDFVYTGKLFYAVYDLVMNDYFPSSSRVLIVHSGGLQGNRSLPAGLLQF